MMRNKEVDMLVSDWKENFEQIRVVFVPDLNLPTEITEKTEETRSFS